MSPSPTLADIDDRSDVLLLVRSFYRDAATDTLLGPVFEAAEVDWPTHIDKLTDFWAWQLLGEPGYEGNPLRAHEPIHQELPFATAHFTRWLELFTATVDAHFTGPVADTAKQRAVKMAHALQRILRGDHRPADPADRGVEPSDSCWIEELDDHQCRALLATAEIGRLAVARPADGPLVVPVNFTLADNSILFRSGFGTKLRALSSRPVSFEVDHHDSATRTGWSVLVRGRAREVRARDVDPPLPEPWAPDDKPYLVQLRIRSMTGRRISRRPSRCVAVSAPRPDAEPREPTESERLADSPTWQPWDR